ncbi:ABC transporter substrate-binding protein [Streptomyces sp. NPDC057963]|uniref:ABC transporter substrate-binding protein n=1 Tax=Streptomyces sp. NPDC057963 TaxID=3346290 RepID=UPI0036EF9650
MRRSGVAAVAVVVALCFSAACDTAAARNVFRLGGTEPIDSMNPFVAVNSSSYSVFENIYPSLVQVDPALKTVPDFAANWQRSPDGKTWTFHTKPGAKWSDGEPLTAADAAWTFETVIKHQEGPTGSLAGYVAYMESATAPDPHTLVLKYSRPVANVLAQMSGIQILPEHIWARYAVGSGKGLLTFTNPAPVVSGGPFTLVKYAQGRIALLKRNPRYYGPAPHIDGLGLQFFDTDDAMITALKSGRLDGVQSVAPTSVATLKAAGLIVASAAGAAFDDLIVNANPKQAADHRELVNPLVREAFDRAIDRNAIVRTALLGFGRPGASIIPPSTGHWSDPTIRPTPYDPAAANRFLDEAGYRMGPNKIRIANGHPMSYTVIMPASITNGYGARSFQIIQAGFKKIGVQLVPKHMDVSAANEALFAEKYQSFEAAMWGFSLTTDPDGMLSYLTCRSRYSLNDTGYCTKSWDGLYAKQATAMNPAVRQRIVHQMQQAAAREHVYLVLDYPDSIEAHSPSWTGLPMIEGGSFSATSKIPFQTVHRVG